MEAGSRIFVAGHRGLVGSAICRSLARAGYARVLTCARDRLDLRDAAAVDAYFARERPEYVVIAAAKVGGILANMADPVGFLMENLKIEQNLIEAGYRYGVERLLFLGSSAMYPKLCAQPMREEYVGTGELEPTNRAYAVAKIAGAEMCAAYNRQYGTRFLAALPANLYGPGDHFEEKTAHLVPALLRRFAEAAAQGARSVEVWGSGTARRELLYSEDCAEACLFLLALGDEAWKALLANDLPLINVGTGEDLTIRELAEKIAVVTGFAGEIAWDTTKPDGAARKLLEVTRMRALGWSARTALDEGLRQTLEAFHASAGRANRT
jgi:GDP-L-fucose synthase